MEQILLKKNKSKTDLNDNTFLGVNLITKKMLLPNTSMDSILNLKEQYDNERDNCNTIRLVCTINPLCTNVLFNNKTEVVVDEGSDDPIVSVYRNYVISADTDLHNLAEYTYTKNVKKKTYNTTKLIQDTQLSRFDNISYHCGLDFFNNHNLRNTTFKSVTLPKTTSDFIDVDNDEYTNPDTREIYFNTIRDYLRNYHGEITYGYADIILRSLNYQLQLTQDSKLHLYLHEDINSFKSTVDNELKEENGWLGFINSPNLPPYDTKNKIVNINKPINNKESCAFVDMYPNRELFYFTPIYNKYRHRIEKNWNYCLTYPSSSTTNVSFINTVDRLNAIKIAVYDDEIQNSKGVESILLFSTCKHGLKQNDIINLYETFVNENNELENRKVINGIFVNEINDEYSFYINKNGNSLSELDLEKGSWVDLSDEKNLKNYEKVCEYVYTNKERTNFYPVIQDKVNLSENNMNFSFKKVVNSVECDYYVRIFSRLPNWKFRKEKPTEYEMYKKDSDLIERFQQLENDFESHCGQVGFARNIYNDDVSEIVFTDDIDLTNLKDNLGRPLTSIYLTILKNNRGYKDWYNNPSSGITEIFSSNDSKKSLPQNDLLKNNASIEFSHCFGKLTNNFKLSYRSLINKDLKNVLRTSVVFDNESEHKNNEETKWARECSSGLDYSLLNNKNRGANLSNEEVSFQYYNSKNQSNNLSGDVHFYGDVVCFSPSEFTETSLQMSDFRFNTAQREYDFDTKSKYYRIGNTIKHDEIVFDDYDYNFNLNNISDSDRNTAKNFSAITKNGFSGNESKENSVKRKEGYYYQGHYEIPIHNFASTLSTQMPKFYRPLSIVYNEKDKYFLIKTMDKTYLELNDVFYLYNIDLAEQSSYYLNGKKVNIIEDDKYVRLTVIKVIDRHRIFATCEKDDLDRMTLTYYLNNIPYVFYRNRFKMFKPDETVPNYAYLLKDKSFRFIWRDFVHNGDSINGTVEEYPYTNDALYINKSINFYLKRQDPNNYVKDYSWDGYSLQSKEYPYDGKIKAVNIDNENNYYEEKDIEC